MSILNRRNAVLGWGVWKIGKRIGKRKIKQAAPGSSRTSRFSTAKLALVGGALAGGFVAARRLG